MINELAQQIAQQLSLDPGVWSVWITIALRFTLVATVFTGGISVLAMFAIWWERKVAGHMQSRLGPMHVGGWHGWAQSIADGAKLLMKEDLIPSGADGFLFRLAPYLAFAPVFAAFLALPFGPQWVFEAGLNIGVLYLLAVLSVEVMGVILAGWGSNSKWAIYGAMREACQMVSYEIPLGISIICGVLVAGTLQLLELSYLQGGGITSWFVFHNPFIFIAFLLYFIASLASNKRAPFDLPESESELVAGFHTEYSGMRFSFFFFAEYAGIFVVGAIQASLFLGGWNSPLGSYDPVYAAIGYNPIEAGQLYFSGALAGAQGWSETAGVLGLSSSGLIALNAYCMTWFVTKAMAVLFVQIWLRWTLPRIRIDQVLHVCVKVLLPCSLVVLVGTAVWIAVVPQPAGVVLGSVGAPGHVVMRLGHLVSPTPTLQWITQIVLLIVALGVLAYFASAVLMAFHRRERNPRKTLFDDVMPVSRDISFTRGAPGAVEIPPAPDAAASQ
ncbi:MAG: NADH-quinone oxidoreductase subunit NuoH [Phycisphaeraceae bacterium]